MTVKNGQVHKKLRVVEQQITELDAYCSIRGWDVHCDAHTDSRRRSDASIVVGWKCVE